MTQPPPPLNAPVWWPGRPDCPRLIEVALPIREISAESVRDKNIHHAHISHLHIWWARRPLAASRAVVFGSLVPDPDDSDCPADFRLAVERHLRTHLPAELKYDRRVRETHRDEDSYRPYEGMPDTPYGAGDAREGERLPPPKARIKAANRELLG